MFRGIVYSTLSNTYSYVAYWFLFCISFRQGRTWDSDHTSFIAALLLPRDLAGWQDYLKIALSFRL